MTLRELRKSRGMTLAQIADELGVSTPTYHRWESGKFKPNVDSLIRIAEKLRVNVSIKFETGDISYE